jgi:hypothetical protein
MMRGEDGEMRHTKATLEAANAELMAHARLRDKALNCLVSTRVPDFDVLFSDHNERMRVRAFDLADLEGGVVIVSRESECPIRDRCVAVAQPAAWVGNVRRSVNAGAWGGAGPTWLKVANDLASKIAHSWPTSAGVQSAVDTVTASLAK